ncbi:Methyltransferase-like protein 22 [Collichthys lucidus]|uniref:Methyltransferase-like protein 22 n=1 Tax=Collichthys lucidus TaxID=240159 RepID=A0A4U5VLX1_COLLU|nr:Methyltransferase-like protein 22 [Collichthys lucidus]
MEQISFHHDTVLSDVHMLLPNGRRLMTRLNCVGQPVFTSYFKMLSDGEKHDNGKDLKKADKYNDPRKDSKRDTKATQGKDGEDGEEGNLEQFMDEDGDLDIHYRPWKTPTEGSGRDLVCPVILKQSNPVLEQEEETMADEVDTCFRDIIRIEHTMATPLEDVGKQRLFSVTVQWGAAEPGSAVHSPGSSFVAYSESFPSNPVYASLPTEISEGEGKIPADPLHPELNQF